ncbi:MAG: shikimate dehydrogenase [Bacteroidales bacterium]|jgi:shikimate dehydrogenase|nr:shikimate dehydrogenase [Bacteroidales bacterium]
MRKFGLIGYPLGHSFSKKYFTEKFIREGIPDCTYENYPLTDISQLQELPADPELVGLNVTIPYKTAVMPFLGRIDPEAAAVGAVNVIKIKRHPESTELRGFNSDIYGIADTLKPVINQRIGKALVLGTGGSSKAVCHVLASLKIDCWLVSRQKKAGCITYRDLDKYIYKSVGLIVNTTPLGMFPLTEGCPDINFDLLGRNHILFDLVYNPEITTFLRKGQGRGCTVLSGLKMLHSQAEKSWEIWNSDKY